MTLFAVVPLASDSADGMRSRLTARISSFASSFREVSGIWIVDSDSTAEEIRDELRACISGENALLVFSIGYEAAWAGIERADVEWLIDAL